MLNQKIKTLPPLTAEAFVVSELVDAGFRAESADKGSVIVSADRRIDKVEILEILKGLDCSRDWIAKNTVTGKVLILDVA